MRFHVLRTILDKFAGRVRRVFRSSSRDWIREMPRSKRIVTWAGVLLQGTAIYWLISRSLVWPLMWPKDVSVVFLIALVFYAIGAGMMNWMLTSEFVRKTQLESDQLPRGRSSRRSHRLELRKCRAIRWRRSISPCAM